MRADQPWLFVAIAFMGGTLAAPPNSLAGTLLRLAGIVSLVVGYWILDSLYRQQEDADD